MGVVLLNISVESVVVRCKPHQLFVGLSTAPLGNRIFVKALGLGSHALLVARLTHDLLLSGLLVGRT